MVSKRLIRKDVSMRRLATVGYEGASVPDFLATLEGAGIDIVIDVRELPLSRRKGFSKTVLGQNLLEIGIEYLHLRDLGDPKTGRTAARAGRMAEFRKIYSRHLNTAKAQAALGQVMANLKTKKVCLLCFERDPNTCHRKMITDFLAQHNQVTILHLGIRSEQKRVSRKFRDEERHRSSQGLAAA